MSESLYVGAYWGNRKETAEECASRLETLLTVLSGCDEVFSRWYEKGRSAGEARREISITTDSLKELLERGRNRRDRDRAVIEELGFRLSVWNGWLEEQADLTLQCGSCASTPSTWIPNSCVLNLPSHGAAGERLRKVGVLIRIVDTFVQAFQPTWAVLTSHEYRETAAKAEPGVPLVGWLTYVRVCPNRLPPLPPGTRVVPAGDSGSVIVTTDAPLTMENSEHVSSVNQVRDALSTAGLLQRSA